MPPKIAENVAVLAEGWRWHRMHISDKRPV